MASIKHERIWNLLNEHNFHFISPLNDELLCVICKTILKNPYQSPCGCRYCMQCISDFLNNNEKNCPGLTADCKEQFIDFSRDLQVDYIINIKISMIKVECPIVDCKFTNELRNMENHINSHGKMCPYSHIGCSFPTNQMELIIDHLNTNYYDHGKLLAESYANMRNELDSVNLSFNLAKQESEKKDKKLMELENQLDNLRDFYSKKIKGLNETITYYMEKNKELTAALLKYETNSHNFTETRGSKVGKEFNSESILSTRDFHSKYRSYAPFIWKVDQFRSKQDFTNKNNNLTSISFYSRNDGYKFCISIYPNGTGNGFQTHLSVFIHIMNGEFDDHLSWPMKLELRICLMDHGYGNLYCNRTFKYDLTNPRDKYMFDRPSTYKNMGIGESQFISLVNLYKNDRIYLNDSIILKCYVN